MRGLQKFWESLFEKRESSVDFRRGRENCVKVQWRLILQFWEERRIMGPAVSENVAVKGLHVVAAQDLGIVGFNLLTQPTEITISLFIFDKQWHTCS